MKKVVKIVLILLLALGMTSVFAQQAEGPSEPNKKLYNFTFVDMDYDAVFRSLSVTAGVDIVLAPDVKGKMSLKITKKTWQETLDIICEIYDLTWLIQDKYITIQRSSTYQAKLKKIADEEAQVEQNSPLVRKNFQLQHAKAQDLVTVLEKMASNRGRITVVERTNSIIVFDTDGRIEQMEKALEELDVETLQIMITAKLVVVNSELARELGVDWTATMGSMNTNQAPGTAVAYPVVGSPNGSGAGDTRMGTAIRSFPNNGQSPAVNNASTAITTSILDNHLQLAISNLMGDASTEVLASPQVSTLDNTEAQVFMGDKVSIRVIDDSGESSTQLVETGIKLTVTPQVSGDNRILLDLHPENNSYDYDSKGEIVISTQEAKTKVVVADGETVVIGGLTRNETQESESGIPFLKDIPLFGNLFKYSRKSVVKKDLVIFVTPRIIRNYIGSIETSEASVETSGTPTAQKVEQKPAEKKAPAAAPAKQQAAPAASKAPAAPAPAQSDSDWD